MQRLTPRSPLAYLRPITVFIVALLWLTAGSSLVAAASVPPGAKEALAPVTKMIATLVAITIGLGIAISGAVIVRVASRRLWPAPTRMPSIGLRSGSRTGSTVSSG